MGSVQEAHDMTALQIDADSHWTATRAEWRRHWPTGVATLLGLGLGASIFPNISSLFILPLQGAFGWSRGEIAMANNAALILALLNPAIGRLIDRHGARPVLLCGFVGVAAAWTGLSLMPGSIWIYYALFALLSLSGFATSGVGFSRAMAAVFVRSRGFSLAVGRCGLALMAASLPPLLFALMQWGGWRTGYAAMATLTVLIAIPAVYWGIERDRQNHAIRQTPAGLDSEGGGAVSWRDLLRDPRVWAITAGAACAYMPLLAIISQLQPLLIEVGLTAPRAAAMVGMLGLAALAGAFGAGLLLDRANATMTAAGIMLLSALGVGCLLLSGHDTRFAYIGVILIGASQGAEIDIVAFMIARYFPIARFGSVFGICTVGITSAGVLGMAGIGVMFDRTGGYAVSLIIALVLFVCAALAYVVLGRLPVERHPD